ncbi:hypothetical protein MKX01_005469 [Papaver californicum]|nr:hypothetical protein MKX01_005469 [Papaver californicum]
MNISGKKYSISLESMEEVEGVFKRFDANGDGKISSTELSEVLKTLGSETSPEKLKEMMDEIDTDGDGFIDLKEFVDYHRGTTGGRNIVYIFKKNTVLIDSENLIQKVIQELVEEIKSLLWTKNKETPN